MAHKRFDILLLISVITLILSFGVVRTVSTAYEFFEFQLNQDTGYAYEINADHQGNLWISDYGAGEVWMVNPATNTYTIYHSSDAPGDARRASNGDVWWVEQKNDQLNRLNPTTNVVTRWDIPASSLYGTTIDAGNIIWLSDYVNPRLYRFKPDTSQLCTYSYGNTGGSFYIVADGTDLWLGDWKSDSIHRFESSSSTLTSWALPGNALPEGLALSAVGDFWWADPDLGSLQRLEPGINRLTIYDLPYGSTPEMVFALDNGIWYTEDTAGSLGRLDPATASGSSQIIISATKTLAPVCVQITPAAQETLTITTGTTAWSAATYTTAVDANGWLVRELPVDAYPWGITASGGGIWVVDNGRQVLIRMQETVTISACKQLDADGNLETAGDRTPGVDWRMYLLVDDVRQEPGQLTDGSGCVTWRDLAAGESYGVEEHDPDGWTALTPITHSFGTVLAGNSVSYTFINHQDAIYVYLPMSVKNYAH